MDLGPVRRHRILEPVPMRRCRGLESIPVRRHCSLEPVHAPILLRGDAEQEPGKGKGARQPGTDHRPHDREGVRIHAGERSIVSAPPCAIYARRERAKLAPLVEPRLRAAAQRGRPLTGGELANLSGERGEAVMLASTWR